MKKLNLRSEIIFEGNDIVNVRAKKSPILYFTRFCYIYIVLVVFTAFN